MSEPMNRVTFGLPARRLPMAELPPCTACGACCTDESDYGVVADLEEEDVARLGPRRLKRYAIVTNAMPMYRLPPALAHQDHEKHYATASVERGGFIVCRALRGTVGKRVSCKIYEDRPNVCRGFKRGGEACLDALREVGLLP